MMIFSFWRCVVFFLLPVLISKSIALETQRPTRPLIVYIHETLYATHKESLEKACDFPICLKPFCGSTLEAKILLEGTSLKADIVVGLEGEKLHDPRIKSLATPLAKGLFKKLSLPFSWESDLFLPFSYAYFGFLYDTRVLKPSVLSLGSFLESLPNKSLVISDPRTSMVGRAALAWIPQALYPQLHKKVLTYPKGWSGAFSLFKRGKAQVMFTYITSILYHHKKGEFFIRPFLFKKLPHPLQVMVAFSVGEKKPHPKGEQFLAILLSPEIQQRVVAGYSYPVTDISLPKPYEKLRPQKAFLLMQSPKERAKNLRYWMKTGYTF